MAPDGKGRRKSALRNAQRRSRRGVSTSEERTPLEQVIAKLSVAIENGFGDAGDRLPPEARLATEIGVSRHLLRRAIAVLVKAGILRSVPHKGTFVAPNFVVANVDGTSRLVDAFEDAGFTVDRRTLSARTGIPPARVARALGVASRTPVIELVRLLTANDAPVGYVTVWLPADRFDRLGELVNASGSLRRALEKVGVGKYRRKHVQIASRYVAGVEQKWLKAGARTILIGVSGVSVDGTDEPTHVFEYWLVAERITLEFTL